MENIIEDIRRELIESADEKTKASSQSFFKEKIRFYGVKTALTGKIGDNYFKGIKSRPKAEIFGLCEELWQSGYIEESFIACNWSYALRKQYEPDDFKTFEHWISTYVGNWASCDTLCNHTVGEFLEMYPGFIGGLKRWAQSPSRWMRRASAVSLIIPARHGKFLPEVLEIAGILLSDSDDLVQKGYGWMLKAASQAYKKEIFEYVMSKKTVMPRTALRYAIEKMPPELKTLAMAK